MGREHVKRDAWGEREITASAFFSLPRGEVAISPLAHTAPSTRLYPRPVPSGWLEIATVDQLHAELLQVRSMTAHIPRSQREAPTHPHGRREMRDERERETRNEIEREK